MIPTLPVCLLSAAAADKPNAPAEPHCLSIDYERSWIEIEAHALGGIPAALRFKSFQATLCLDEKRSSLRCARFELPYDQLSSGSEGRDRKVKKWLETRTHPNGYYDLQVVSPDGDGDFAKGQLWLHGEAHPAEFRYEIASDGDGVILEAVSKIDYHDWGLPPLRIFIFKVDPILTIHLRIAGTIDATAKGSATDERSAP